MSWALLFIALLALAGLYEGAVFLTERLWGVRPSEGLRLKGMARQAGAQGPGHVFAVALLGL